MEMFVYERLPCCSHSPTDCKHKQDIPHVLVTIHTLSWKLLILQACSVFNYSNITTYSLSQLGKLNNHALFQLTLISISYLYFWSFNTKLMSLRACSDSPPAEWSLSASCSRAAGNLFSTTALQAELFLAMPSVGGG